MQQGEDKPIVKPPPVYAPTKFLISSLNTFLGNTLVRRLRNDHIHPQNPNRILGTTCPAQPDMSVPDGVRKVIDTQKVKFFEEIVLNSDVIIYDLNTCDLKEAEFAISTLKINNFSEEKTLICLSNVMTWAKSKPKQKKQGDEEEGDDNPPQQPDTEVEGGDGGGQQQKKTYVRFLDKDYTLRKPDPEYEKIKSIETLCMAAGKVKSNLKSFVICSGIIYGEGERLFAPYFMQARQQRPEALSFYGNGKNRIPMVHIEDLTTYVEKVIDKKPNLPYILALDHNPKPTQGKAIEQISKGIGTGKTRSIPVDESDPNIKFLTLNLRMKPTMIFAKIEQEQAAIERQEGDETPKFTFKWVCKEGLQKNIKKLCEEFNSNRGLKQTKIFITGPPGSGKTFFCKQLAQKYYLPHIHIKQVIEQVKGLQNEFGEEVRNAINQKKQQMISTKQTEYEQLKEKQKKIPKELRDPLEPFDPEKVDVRLSDELIYKCYQWRLNQNDCLNRGYILDGYPKKYEDGVQLFMGLPPTEEDQEPDENQQKIVIPKLIPNKLIVLEMSDECIISRLQNLPEEQILGTHFGEVQTKKRLKIYRDSIAVTGEFVLQDFFKENQIQIHHVDATSQGINILQSIIKPMALNQAQEQNIIQKKIDEQARKRSQARQQMSKKQSIIRNIQNEDYVMKKQNQQNEEREILDKTSLALRKYLDVNLVPILSEGIVKILKDFPEDPVDKLAQFLFQNSLKVPNPDPSTFEF